MRNEILWIAFCTTLAFWLGCAGQSGEQNYKVLDDDRPMLQPERPTGGPGGTDSTSPVNLVPVNPQTVPAPQATQLTRHGDAGTPQAPLSDEAPSTTTLDRSGWSVIRTEPRLGETPHHPVYFYTWIDKDDTRLIDRTTDPDELLAASLAGDAAENLSARNGFNFLWEPLWFAKDFPLFPIRAVQQVPWSIQTTP